MNCVVLFRLTEMEILYKKEKEEADQLLEQQRLVSSIKLKFKGPVCKIYRDLLAEYVRNEI